MAADSIAEKFGGVVADDAEQQPQQQDPQQPAPAADDPVAAKFGGVVADAQPAEGKPTQGQPEHDTDFGSAALRGLKQTLAPFLLSKEDIDGPRTGAEIGTEVGVNLASDVALGAGIGALVGPEGALGGAAMGALVHAAMATYRGFGYEYAHSKAEGQTFNPIKGVVNTITQINPLVGKGNRLIKASTQALAEFVQNYQYSGDEHQAETQALFGGVVAGLLHHNTGTWLAMTGSTIARPGSQTDRAAVLPAEMHGTILALADTSETGLGGRIMTRVKSIKSESPDYFKLGNLLEQAKADDAPVAMKAEVESFKRWWLDQPGMSVQNGDLDTSFDHAVRAKGAFLEKDYATYKTQEIVNNEVTKYKTELEQDLLGRSKDGKIVRKADSVGPAALEDPTTYNWVDKLRDIKFQMRNVDSTLGTNFEGMIDNFSAAKNRASTIAMPYLTLANKLTKAARKADLPLDEVGRFLAEEDINFGRAANRSMSGGGGPGSVDFSHWTDEQRQVAEGWRTLFESVRTRLKNEGLSIDFLDKATFEEGGKYLPMRGKSGADAAAEIRKEADRLHDQFGSSYLERPESHDLRRVVSRYLGNDPDEVLYRNQVEQAQLKALSPTEKASTGYEAHMTFQREPGLPAPEFIRDFDVGKLFTGYLNNGLKASVYHDPFVQLNSSLDMLKAMGFNNSADYLEKYITHISGQPGDFVARLTANANQYKDTLNRMIEGIKPDDFAAGLKTNALQIARGFPDFASFAISSIYPNFLGWNIRAALRDFTKPFLLTAPELGWDYGSRTVLKAIGQAAWDKLKGMNLEHELESRSLIPAKHLGIMGDVTDTGLRSAKGAGAAAEQLERFQVWSMKMYSETDKMNRYIQLKAGHQIAKDLQGGDPRALKYVQNQLSQGNKAAIRDLGISTLDDLKSVDPGKLGDLLGQQLIAKTSFNYGKEGMSEFGRDMGRVFSMFTKWPAMMIGDSGDLLNRYGRGVGTLKVIQRYVAPMAAMMFMGKYLMDTEHNPYQRFLVGQNLSEWAPAQSWKIGTPPLLQTAQDFGKTFMETFSAEKDKDQKLSGWQKFARRQALAYVPGMSVVNEYDRYKRAMDPESFK